MDVLSASANDGKIAWYENDGQGNFGDQQIITKIDDNALIVHAADLDGDGNMDVVAGSGGRIVWSRNSNGNGTFGEQQTITIRDGISRNVAVGDLDGDGDLDVVSSSYDDDTIAWYENTEGQGNFREPQTIALVNGAFGISIGDLDGDGDLDVLSGSLYFTDDEGAKAGTIAWHENRLLGDSNDDGVFDSSDLVAVFQAGKYEDGIDENATFDEGDGNNDGEFDSADLVAAFQAGQYVAAATPRVSHVAATIDWIFAADDDLDNDSIQRQAFVA